ncbi:DUF2957 domain-containing protein [Paraburkholderia sp. GAS199]|uniref:DUF2957 domain-containing protein n=1 Tax=Paraburkholderia sp. GAS199 TaxID=3035126 RepID=UPI003D22809A
MFKLRGGHHAALIIGALALPVLLAACGGGKADDPAAVAVPQCSGSSCPAQGQPAGTPVTVAKLCPDTLDYSTTYTGGSGSGEYIKVKFDSTKKQYQMTFVESAVPTSAGQVNDTRAGMTIIGDYDNPNGALALPTAEQTRCAIMLKNGATADGTYHVTINPQDPPMLFVGQGIIGGGIPGATIQYDGLELVPGLFIGTVPSRTFDSYPFLGFSQTVTDFTQVAGKYNELGFRVTPEGTVSQSSNGATMAGWEPDAIQASETFNADGTCTPDSSKYSCISTGMPWTLRSNTDGTPDNVFTSSVPASLNYPVVGTNVLQLAITQNQAHGIMIVGKVNNQLVPVVIRVGYAHTDASNLLANVLDDQLGISLLAPATTIAPTALKGGYIGANSASACGVVAYQGQSSFATLVNGQTIYPSAGACLDASASLDAGVNYGATLFQSPTAALLNPFTSAVSTNFSLDFTQTQPGLVNVTANKDFLSGNTPIFKAGDTGVMVQVGPVYGVLMNGVNTQYTTYDPANNVSKVNPFLSIGAFVQ